MKQFHRRTNDILESQEYSPDIEYNEDSTEPVASSSDHGTFTLSVHSCAVQPLFHCNMDIIRITVKYVPVDRNKDNKDETLRRTHYLHIVILC